MFARGSRLSRTDVIVTSSVHCPAPSRHLHERLQDPSAGASTANLSVVLLLLNVHVLDGSLLYAPKLKNVYKTRHGYALKNILGHRVLVPYGSGLRAPICVAVFAMTSGAV